MPIDAPTAKALESLEPIFDRLDLDACLRNLKETWAVNAIDEGSGSQRTQALYTYARPEYAVAQAIADGATPDEALSEWQSAIHKMLAEVRPKRRHILLVEAISALRHAGAPLPGQPSSWPDGDRHLEANGGISPLDLALATLAVYQTGEVRQLLGELAASTVPLPGWNEPPRLDLQRIHEDLKALPTQTQLKDTQEENDLLLLQLHHVQEELEEYYLRHLELERKTRGPEPKKEKTSVRDLERRVQLIENSTSWRLTAPLRLFSKILSRKKGPNAAPNASAPEEKRIRYLQRRVEQLETSTSWRVTAPLRAVGLLFKGGPSTPAAFFPLAHRKSAHEEAHKHIKSLEGQLTQESENRRKAEQLAEERSRQLSQESENRHKAEQFAEQRSRQLSQESENLREAEQLAEERSRQLSQASEKRRNAEQLAEERNRQLAELQRQLHQGQQERDELHARQTLLQEELIRAEAQINLIKDLLLKEESL